MANFLFYADAPHLRRADQQNVIIAPGANRAEAQSVAEQLIGEQSGALSDWTAVTLAVNVAPCTIETNHTPVGSNKSGQATWPSMTRGGNWLLG